MMKIFVTLSILLMSQGAFAQGTDEQPDRADVQKFYSLVDSSIGLKGYDPVAYFTEEKAVVGDASIAQAYGGVIYNFSSVENRDLFNGNPAKFEPTYGGWCAWARAQGQYANINPELFVKSGDNRMHFFISRGVRARFISKLAQWEEAADESWVGESGESPRK